MADGPLVKSVAKGYLALAGAGAAVGGKTKRWTTGMRADFQDAVEEARQERATVAEPQDVASPEGRPASLRRLCRGGSTPPAQVRNKRFVTKSKETASAAANGAAALKPSTPSIPRRAISNIFCFARPRPGPGSIARPSPVSACRPWRIASRRSPRRASARWWRTRRASCCATARRKPTSRATVLRDVTAAATAVTTAERRLSRPGCRSPARRPGSRATVATAVAVLPEQARRCRRPGRAQVLPVVPPATNGNGNGNGPPPLVGERLDRASVPFLPRVEVLHAHPGAGPAPASAGFRLTPQSGSGFATALERENGIRGVEVHVNPGYVILRYDPAQREPAGLARLLQRHFVRAVEFAGGRGGPLRRARGPRRPRHAASSTRCSPRRSPSGSPSAPWPAAAGCGRDGGTGRAPRAGPRH